MELHEASAIVTNFKPLLPQGSGSWSLLALPTVDGHAWVSRLFFVSIFQLRCFLGRDLYPTDAPSAPSAGSAAQKR